MKLPNSVNVINTKSVNDQTKLVIKTDETYKIPMYEIPEEDINEVKYIKSIEKIIRNSFEYRSYIQLIKDEFNLNNCKFFNNIDLSESKISLELHHYPCSLYDIVAAVREEKLQTDRLSAYKTFDIAEDVMKIHYEGLVGLVPLTITAHKLAHSGDLFIPLTEDYVFGDYESLLKDDRLIFDDTFYEVLEAIKNMTNEYIETGINKTEFIFNNKEVEIIMKESQSPQKVLKEKSKFA